MPDKSQNSITSLEAVLAEMVLCALAWEDLQEQGGQCSQRKGLTGTAPPIHCPSLGETTRQQRPESEDENGWVDPNYAAPMDIRRSPGAPG